MVEEGKDDNADKAQEGETSPTEESETPKPRKMAIPPEVQARLGEPVTIDGKDPNKVKDMQIHDLEMEVSDMRGKFIIPKLKKIAKYHQEAEAYGLRLFCPSRKNQQQHS